MVTLSCLLQRKSGWTRCLPTRRGEMKWFMDTMRSLSAGKVGGRCSPYSQEAPHQHVKSCMNPAGLIICYPTAIWVSPQACLCLQATEWLQYKTKMRPKKKKTLKKLHLQKEIHVIHLSSHVEINFQPNSSSPLPHILFLISSHFDHKLQCVLLIFWVKCKKKKKSGVHLCSVNA